MLSWKDELYHYGIPHRSGRYPWGSGKNPYHHSKMKWVNPDGTLTEEGKKRYSYRPSDSVFISGKVSYDKPIDKTIRSEVDRMIQAGAKINIGDAPGADTRVQQYLTARGYKNVTVYSTDAVVRNNIGNWAVKYIRSQNGEQMTEREIRRLKDIAMTTASTRGFAICPSDDRLESATSLNIARLIEQDKPTIGVQF